MYEQISKKDSAPKQFKFFELLKESASFVAGEADGRY